MSDIGLAVMGGVSLAEVLIWLGPKTWRLRKPLAAFLAAALLAANLYLAFTQTMSWVLIVTVLSLYRLVNLRRVVTGRGQADYLYHTARRTSYWLIGLQLITVGLARLSSHFGWTAELWLAVTAGLQLTVALTALATVNVRLKHARPPAKIGSYSDHDLPSLTVALPARNETADLQACLEALVTSTYPKLEILVLDDCSQNKQTPEIIRSFAHAGVRFIAGKVPPSDWLAKNYAYHQLAQQANGEILLFCGVDTRFRPDSLKTIVSLLLQNRQAMISVMPSNDLPAGRRNPFSTIVQPARYAWELSLPQWLLRRPAVLSTCWLITAAALAKAGGFKAVSRGHLPESYFARRIRYDGSYGFLRSDERISLSSAKTPEAQRATAIRTRYPQLHRRIELAALVSLGELTALIGPLLIFALSLNRGWLWPASVSGLAELIQLIGFSQIMALTYRHWLWRGPWLQPFAVAYDIALLNYSMWKYEFSEVIWKGRNVCIPVMRLDKPKDAAAAT